MMIPSFLNAGIDPGSTCCVLLPARIDEAAELRLRRTVRRLVRQGVTIFLVEQSDAFTPSIRLLRKLAGRRLAAITHFPAEAGVSWSVVRADYEPPFSHVLDFDPNTRMIGGKIRRTAEAMLGSSAQLICLLEPGGLLEQTLGKTIRRQAHLMVFDLAEPSER